MEIKRSHLEDLERTEREASRLEEALGRGRITGPMSRSVSANGATVPDGENEQSTNDEAEEPNDTSAPYPVYTPPEPPSGPKRGAPGMGLLSALSYTLHGMMDVDPETARRNSISKTRESISQVCLLLNVAVRRRLLKFVSA